MSNVNAAGERCAVAFLTGRSTRAVRTDCVACDNAVYPSRSRKGRAFGGLLVVLVAAVFAVGLVAFPGAVLADESVTTLTQSDFDNEGGVYVIDGGGSYKLDGNVTGAIKISKVNVATAIDLNGKTLTCPSDTTADAAIDIENWGDDRPGITIKNGSIVHEKDGGLGIGMWRRSTSLTLEDLNVSVTNSFCVNAYGSGSSLTIRRGSYVINKSNPDVMNAATVMAYAGTVTVDQYDATFTINGGDDVVKADGGAISLKGGNFNKFPSQATIASNYAMYKSSAEGSTWNVMDKDEACAASLNNGSSTGWAVEVANFGTVYFESEDDAKEFAESKGAEVSTAAVAKVGDTYYESLKAAVKAADSGSKVELLKDTTEKGVEVGDGKSLTIDLGGHTLSGDDVAYTAITKTGSGTLEVCNGTISCKGSCVEVGSNSASAQVTLTDVEATSTSRYAAALSSGTLNIKSGTYVSEDKDYDAVMMNAYSNVTIEGGSFYGGSGVDVHKNGERNPSISGGDFSNVKPVSYVTEGHSMQYGDGRYYVVDTSDNDKAAAVKDASSWALVTAGGQRVYYADADKSQAESDRAALSGSELKQIFRVTFNDYEGNPVATQPYVDGETIASLPSEGSRSGYSFLGWYNGDTKAEANVTTVSTDATYTAAWELNAVARVGSTYYGSLQDAVNAAGAGDTVQLLKDTTENVVVNKTCDEFTIDLNGFTLTGKGQPASALQMLGSSKVVVTNGTVTSSWFAISVDGGTTTLKDGEKGLKVYGAGRAVNMSGGSNNVINIEGGELKALSTVIEVCGQGNVLNVYGGTFLQEESASPHSDSAAIWASGCKVNVWGGWFPTYLKSISTTQDEFAIRGGSYGNDNNRADVVDGYLMQGPDGDGRYTVVKDSAAPVINGLTAGATYEGAKTFTVSDESSVTVEVGDVTLTPDASGNYTLAEDTLGSLEGELTVTATDAADNSTGVAVKWYKGHDWSAWSQSADGTGHVRTCSHCGKTETGNHVAGEAATCTSKAICKDCGLEFGETDPSNHSGTEVDAWSSDDEHHWHACSACGEPYSFAVDHSYEVVVDKAATVAEEGQQHKHCTICQRDYDYETIPKLDPGAPAFDGIVSGACYDVEPAKFKVTADEGATLIVTANGTTLVSDADGYYTLPQANGTVTVVAVASNGTTEAKNTVTVSSYASHSWRSWDYAGDGKHVRACTHAGCSGTEAATCSGDEATCVSESVCKDCGHKLADKDPNNHVGPVSTTWESDGEGHWHVCSACDGRVDEAGHDFETVSDGETGHHQKCKTCGYETDTVGHDLKLTYEDESGHWQECEDCGYATDKVAHELTWVVTKAATATEDGLEHQECSECGYRGADVVIPKTGGDSSDDDDDKGDDSGDKGGKSDGSKGDDAKKLPATGDPVFAVSGLAAAGAALAALGLKRRK